MNQKERNVGIELLRIIAMFGITVLHVLGKGGVLENLTTGNPVRYTMIWLLEILSFFGVTTYALISGFVGVDSKFRITNIIYTYLRVLFFTVVLGVIGVIITPAPIDLGTIAYTFFPVSTGHYWYFSAYFLLFFVMPFINKAFEKIDVKVLRIILWVLVIALSVHPVFFNEDPFGVNEGYSFVWLLAAYFIGAYMKKKGRLINARAYTLVILILVSLVFTLCFKVGLDLTIGAGGDRLLAYNSPTILVISVALVSLFARLKIEDERCAKAIRTVSRLSFGVYLFTCEIIIWEYVIDDRFKTYATYPVWKAFLCTILTSLVIFLIGIALDAIRNLIFELGNLREKLNVINDLILKDRCPCCGQTFVDKYDICDVCGWENDPVQSEDPTFAGGANKESLEEYKKKFYEELKEAVESSRSANL